MVAGLFECEEVCGVYCSCREATEALNSSSAAETMASCSAMSADTWDLDLESREKGAGAMKRGARHALLIDGAGSVWSWGENSQGQLGLEGTKRLFRPARIEVLYHMQVGSPLASSRLTV